MYSFKQLHLHYCLIYMYLYNNIYIARIFSLAQHASIYMYVAILTDL